jgi:oligosaccharide repeat unit polymerase wzy
MFLILSVYIGLFFLYPIITTPLILIPLTHRFKYSKIFLILFVLGISLIILRYIPFPTDDGAYHYKAAYLYQSYDNIFEWFSYLMSKDIPTEYGYYNYPLFGLLLYIFSNTGTYSLISFVVCFTVYYLYSSIILDIFQKSNISKWLFLVGLIIILTFVNIRYTASGMRYALAVSITVSLFYKEIRGGFSINKSLFYYLIPILIHASSLIFVLLRILFPLLKNDRIYKKILVLFTFPVLSIVLPIFNINNGYFSFLVEKFDSYQITENYIVLFKWSDLVYVYVGTLISVIFIVYYHITLRFQKNEKLKNFYKLVMYVCLLTLSVSPFLTLLDRFVWFVYPLVIISVLLFIASDTEGTPKTKGNKYFISYFLLILCFVGTIIWNRNFLEFLRLLDYNFIEILTKNVYEYFSDLHQFSLSEVVRR